MHRDDEADAVVIALSGDVIACCGDIRPIAELWRTGAHTLMCNHCRTLYVYRTGRGWVPRVPDENFN